MNDAHSIIDESTSPQSSDEVSMDNERPHTKRAKTSRTRSDKFVGPTTGRPEKFDAHGNLLVERISKKAAKARAKANKAAKELNTRGKTKKLNKTAKVVQATKSKSTTHSLKSNVLTSSPVRRSKRVRLAQKPHSVMPSSYSMSTC